MATTEEQAYPIMKSLDVDYVLVVFGGMTGYSSDDVNKFLWPVRIGSGVFGKDMPSEEDYYSVSGNYDIGPGGSQILLNSLLYKLCYYNFDKVMTKHQQPPGYDLARNTEVGHKNIRLSHMEEAFTSEHWIVRIFKVKKEPNVDLKGLSKKARKIEKSTDETQEHAKFLGCVTGEDHFSNDRVYTGSSTGANFRLAQYHAKNNDARYFAIARVGADGHAFAFTDLSIRSKDDFDGNDAGCERACMDDSDRFCGCADGGCDDANVERGKGQEHKRRWAVYARAQ